MPTIVNYTPRLGRSGYCMSYERFDCNTIDRNGLAGTHNDGVKPHGIHTYEVDKRLLLIYLSYSSSEVLDHTRLGPALATQSFSQTRSRVRVGQIGDWMRSRGGAVLVE